MKHNFDDVNISKKKMYLLTWPFPVLFNLVYPECKVTHMYWIGDGECDTLEYNNPECGWDGGDCDHYYSTYPNCKVDAMFLVGDGKCDREPYNTEACLFDGGDCDFFNENYHNCTLPEDDDYIQPFHIGDGFCHRALNNSECGWDGGDCGEFWQK